MALGGLWRTWTSPADERIRSFTIVRTTLHRARSRVPVVLKPASLADLARRAAGRSSALEGPVRPYPSDDPPRSLNVAAAIRRRPTLRLNVSA
jgi:putative SOS response-associated peptidase YedK